MNAVVFITKILKKNACNMRELLTIIKHVTSRTMRQRMKSILLNPVFLSFQ